MSVKSRNNHNNFLLSNHNSLNSKNYTYNKPLFIKMTNESKNINCKNSTSSTKIDTTNIESPFDGSYRNNFEKINHSNISVSEFNIDKDKVYSKTSFNFLSKENESSSSSNEENNIYETFTPSRNKELLFDNEEQEQFTPYLGQKNDGNMINKENKNNHDNINNNENINFSNIFNNSKELITNSSLNLKNHLDNELSNNYKSINKFQKLFFYQKHLNPKTSNNIIQRFLNNKNKEIDKQKFHEEKILLIQAIFRGYIYRIKLYNKLKDYTCITIFCKIVNNIFLSRKKFVFNGWIYLSKKQKKNKNNKNFFYKSNRISLCIKGEENKYKNEIQKLIDINDDIMNKLYGININNTQLKNDIKLYKQYENKYNNLLIRFEKMKNSYNIIKKEYNKLIEEYNIIKSKLKENNNTNNNYISPQCKLYLSSDIDNNKDNINNEIKLNKFNNVEIANNINNISILNNRRVNEKNIGEKRTQSLNINYDFLKNMEIFKDIKDMNLIKGKNNQKTKNVKFIIVKKINFIINRNQNKNIAKTDN